MQHVALAFASALLAAGSIGCGDNLTHPPDRDPVTQDGGTLACTPNLDGRIDAAELRAAYDIPVSYLVSPPTEARKVDLEGQSDGKGGHIWDFSQDFASDKLATLTASKVEGKWYAASFPAGQFAAPLDAAGTLDGVYVADNSAISLLGVASVSEKPKEGKTLLVYDAPVAIYRFPLEPGKSWVSTGQVVNGTIRGLPYAGKDTYEVKDDALGTLDLHDFTFQSVHRVRTKVTVAPAVGAATTELQVGFVFECFGEVVRATSKQNETNQDFTAAAEVRRLGK
jgi:hypothetical protein